MSYIEGVDRMQVNIITTSLDELIDFDNPVRVIDAFVDSLNLAKLGFKEYSDCQRGQSPYRRSDLLKLHIYGYLNKIRSSRMLMTFYNVQKLTVFTVHKLLVEMASLIGLPFVLA